jgi:peptidoglycan/xylan/chitin deacetylase (PgdA/CDA1 family)
MRSEKDAFLLSDHFIHLRSNPMYVVRPPYLLKKLYTRGIWRKDTTEKKLYLTFDDGPVPEVTPWVLDVLKTAAIEATFFCVGENAEKHPEIYQRILRENHAVGNHTHQHISGWNTPLAEYIANVEKCAAYVNTTLFRPPYGRIRKDQQRRLETQYTIVMWDVLSGDYDNHTSPEQCLQNVLKNVRNGSIIVFHDSLKAQQNMQYALPRFIADAKAKGFEFAKL